MRFKPALPRWAAARVTTGLILTLCVSACSSLLDTTQELPDDARVIVTGNSPVLLLLVTSTDFVFDSVPGGGGLVPRTITADTAVIGLPFDSTYLFSNTYRFLVRLANPDTAQTASVQLRLLVGGREVFREAATMRDAALQYTYIYR